MSPRASMDVLEKRIISCPCGDFEPPVVQPVTVTIPTALSWLDILADDCNLIEFFCDPCTATVLEPSAP